MTFEKEQHTLKIRRFRLTERFAGGTAEIVFAHPMFISLEEGLEYIHTVLDPYYTGRYGIVERP